MMNRRYHTIVIGGGALGCSVAISLQRMLGKKAKVLLLDKSQMMSGVSSDHSGIFRAVNSNPQAVKMAADAEWLWSHLATVWGVDMPLQKNGALWITQLNEEKRWSLIQESMKAANLDIYALSRTGVHDVTDGLIETNNDELYLYEPNAFTFKPDDLSTAIKNAIEINGIDYCENTLVKDIDLNHTTGVSTVNTSKGKYVCQNLVNACGPWASSLFKQYGINLPVRMEQVFIGNWQLGEKKSCANMPIICDEVNKVYFRNWTENRIHMHQPRDRNKENIKARFRNDKPIDHETEYENYDNWPQLSLPNIRENYEMKLSQRIPKFEGSQFVNGAYRYFDITPDHQFILGKDQTHNNLFHCMGGGQAIKYAPLFGEILAKQVCGLKSSFATAEQVEFSSERFGDVTDTKMEANK